MLLQHFFRSWDRNGRSQQGGRMVSADYVSGATLPSPLPYRNRNRHRRELRRGVRQVTRAGEGSVACCCVSSSFLVSPSGSLFCSCSAYTLRIFCSFLVVFFSVGCGEGSAMTGTAALLPRMVLQCAGDVGGGCCSSEYGLQRVVRGSVQG